MYLPVWTAIMELFSFFFDEVILFVFAVQNIRSFFWIEEFNSTNFCSKLTKKINLFVAFSSETHEISSNPVWEGWINTNKWKNQENLRLNLSFPHITPAFFDYSTVETSFVDFFNPKIRRELEMKDEEIKKSTGLKGAAPGGDEWVWLTSYSRIPVSSSLAKDIYIYIIIFFSASLLCFAKLTKTDKQVSFVSLNSSKGCRNCMAAMTMNVKECCSEWTLNSHVTHKHSPLALLSSAFVLASQLSACSGDGMKSGD